VVRRATYDPFARDANRSPHRICVFNEFSRAVSERKLPAGADLRAEFYAELVRMAQDGWTIEEPFKGTCFISLGEKRWYVSLSIG
jgi:hypothetical protein